MKLSTIVIVTALSLSPTLAFAQMDSSERPTGAVGGATGGSAGGGAHLGADAVGSGRNTGTVGMAPDSRRAAPSTMAPSQESGSERTNGMAPTGTAR